MNKNIERVTNHAVENFKNYIIFLCLPLIGIDDEDISAIKQQSFLMDEIDYNKAESSGDYFNSLKLLVSNDRTVILYKRHLFGNDLYFKITFNSPIEQDQYSLLSYLMIAYFKKAPNTAFTVFEKDVRNAINEIAIQKGLFAYLTSNDKMVNNRINGLIFALDKWAQKTYEGRHVCFGFLIDPTPIAKKDKEEPIGGFLDFIKDEYAATFTDGITSIAKLDSNCDFVEYLSITNLGDDADYSLKENKVPIRFAQVITNYVVSNTIGVFLLVNGDILIARNKEIQFIRREKRWLNFSYLTFLRKIKAKCDEFDTSLSTQLFPTILDISFSHTGGLIAVVDEENPGWEKDVSDERKPIISPLEILKEEYFEDIDSHLKSLLETEIAKVDLTSEYAKEKHLEDTKKRLTKKKYLMELLKNNRCFSSMDRRLRAELSGLDGALIINKKGIIIACGAIIANKAGSSGGGRGSAAKTLSNYGGFAVKVSTDGYVEIFKNEIKIFTIK